VANEWWQPLRELNERYFAGPSDGVRWDDHVDGLNKDLGLSAENQRLSTFPRRDLPPSWFIGDVTAVQPDEWVLVFSLNPATDDDGQFYAERKWNAESFWNFQTGWLHYWFNHAFHGPLARLASLSLGKPLADSEQVRNFAATAMVFAELCPYSSRTFALSESTLERLREVDIACKVEAEMVDLMLAEGQPGLVLVNGNDAVQHFAATFGEALSWEQKTYVSEFKPGKNLWHMEGMLRADGRMTPVIGFPFLKKPATHNATVEIEQLARFARALVGAGS
jgi:hypothetical protein